MAVERALQRIVGESSTLAEALDQVSLVAPLNRPVLVLGERGSGKELIAERIHFLSSRWESSLHKVNCAAISDQLLDSELFGHEPGSFTGATRVHHGRFERAEGGTLFLDELGAMSIRIQEKLLRLIEYGEFERVGGQQTIKVDIRIVAATNADLKRMARKGEFREDLLDRLAFDVIAVPPLRERVEDIPELAEHFALRMSHELGWDYYSGFTQDAMRDLLDWHWPGNIRELKNAVERSLYRWGAKDEPVDQIVIDPFPSGVEDGTKADESNQLESNQLENKTTRSTLNSANSEKTSKDFQQQVKEFELSLLRKALIESQYHQKQAADNLGLTYHQLRALMRKYKKDLGQ
jgi:psp operon transcriptional activator